MLLVDFSFRFGLSPSVLAPHFTPLYSAQQLFFWSPKANAAFAKLKELFETGAEVDGFDSGIEAVLSLVAPIG